MNKHKGFTLIELLIVIVVMGILASMMMLSSSESVSTARANNIISSLRNFSMAAMAFYTDKMDEFGKNPGYLSNNSTELTKQVKLRMHNEGNIPDEEKYEVVNNKEETEDNKTFYTLWVGYDLSEENSRVREKLEARANSAKLCESDSISTPPARGSNSYPEYTKDKKCVWILIRSNRR